MVARFVDYQRMGLWKTKWDLYEQEYRDSSKGMEMLMDPAVVRNKENMMMSLSGSVSGQLNDLRSDADLYLRVRRLICDVADTDSKALCDNYPIVHVAAVCTSCIAKKLDVTDYVSAPSMGDSWMGCVFFLCKCFDERRTSLETKSLCNDLNVELTVVSPRETGGENLNSDRGSAEYVLSFSLQQLVEYRKLHTDTKELPFLVCRKGDSCTFLYVLAVEKDEVVFSGKVSGANFAPYDDGPYRSRVDEMPRSLAIPVVFATALRMLFKVMRPIRIGTIPSGAVVSNLVLPAVWHMNSDWTTVTLRGRDGGEAVSDGSSDSMPDLVTIGDERDTGEAGVDNNRESLAAAGSALAHVPPVANPCSRHDADGDGLLWV